MEELMNPFAIIAVFSTMLTGLVIWRIAKAFSPNGKKSGALPAFAGGSADVEARDGELRLTYYVRLFNIFKWKIGTLCMKMGVDALRIEFQTRRTEGERSVALETVYSVGTAQAKRRPMFLILAIIAAVLSIVIFVTVGWVGIFMLLVAGVLGLLWYFQKKRVEFGILFGGAGADGCGFSTRTDDSIASIKPFLDNLMLSAQKFRTENALNSAKYLINGN